MAKKIDIKFKKLDERAVVPKYAHEGDVGMDLTAIDVEYDEKNDMYIYHTGLAFESDFNIGQFLFVRSSNRKTDAYLCNHVGIADSAIYRGEIMLCFKNRLPFAERIAIESDKAFKESLKNSKVDDVNARLINAVSDSEIKKIDMIKEGGLKYAPYNVGDRVAQMVFIEYPTVNLIEGDELSNTVRNDGGFGSTGN